MPRYPERDLSNQYISLSYQDVLQQYVNTGSVLYVLDGYGNVVFGLPSASIGFDAITSNLTASMTVGTSSLAITTSFTKIYQVSSSFASSSISSSYALTASYVSGSSGASISASYALSASYSGFSEQAGTASLFLVSSSQAANSQTSDFAVIAGNTLYTSSYALTSSYFSYTGVTTGSSAPLVLDGYVQVFIGGTQKWMPFYA
jgi:hypothetical protein